MSRRQTPRSRSRARPVAWILLILGLGALAGYLTLPEGRRSEEVVRSSLRTTPDGVAALSRGIARLGRRTEPRLTPMAEAEPVRGTLVLLQPRLGILSPREMEALLDHVREGGTFIYAPPVSRTGVPGTTPLMMVLGVMFPADERRMLPDSAVGYWATHPLTDGLPPANSPRFGFVVMPEEEPDSSASEAGPDSADAEGRAEEAQPEPEAPRETDDELPELPPGFPDASDAGPPVPLLTAHDSTGNELMATAEVPLGDGRIVILADAAPLANQAAADDPLAALIVRAALAYTSETDTVFFDEFHQGISGYGSRIQVLANFFLGSPGGLTLLSVIAVCFLYLACRGLRFGVPNTAVAPADRERRSPLEHVSALGDLYRKAGSANTAALLMLSRLARSIRRPPPRDLDEAAALVREIEARSGGDASLERVHEGLRSDPVDLTLVAAGVDEHLSRRYSK
ncbi:MAG: DUF4350 domain-containing protein [Gemmatimonadetes bacterium]|nr:DUF4350 domain-containing protein [Gemmatimonadota bacterium]